MRVNDAQKLRPGVAGSADDTNTKHVRAHVTVRCCHDQILASRDKQPRARSDGRKSRTLRVAGWFLALGVLKAFSGARLTVLLALFLTSVAGQEAGLLEAGAAPRIDCDERAGNAVAHRVGLGTVTPAG